MELAKPGSPWRSEAGTASGICPGTGAISEPADRQRPRRAEPPAATGRDAAVADSRIEITLPDGTSIRIGHDVSLATLRRVVTVLRG